MKKVVTYLYNKSQKGPKRGETLEPDVSDKRVNMDNGHTLPESDRNFFLLLLKGRKVTLINHFVFKD